MQRSKIRAVFRHEWRQTFSAGRLLGWLLISAFPVLLTILVVLVGTASIKDIGPIANLLMQRDTETWAYLLFYVCEIVCLLQLLIWATPWLYSELEGRSWTYLSVRPGGKSAVLVGKYLVAATRTMVGVEAALLISLLIARPEDGVKVFLVLGSVIAISSFAYSAVFVLLGALFPRRAMVIAVGYSLVIEFLVSFIPAMINKLSIQYRLRSMLMSWMDLLNVQGSWKPPRGFEDMLGNSSAWIHLLILLVASVVMLFVANLVVSRREHAANAEI